MVQARFWLLTIPEEDWVRSSELPEKVAYLKGQLEEGTERREGAEGGYRHWQLYAHFKRAVRLAAVKKVFGRTCHAEATRSDAAEEYVWKEDTRVEGTRFELGSKPINRNDEKDWDKIRELAKQDKMDEIPSDIYIKCYSSLKRIAAEHSTPAGIEREVFVFCGQTGTGKSKRAWEEAGIDAYPKTPTTKFWDGYRGQEHVVIDEFRGQIEISHMLRWLDRYPVLVEVKGSSTVFKAKKIWITSNLHPKDWYPTIDEETRKALLRRLNITVFENPFALSV